MLVRWAKTTPLICQVITLPSWITSTCAQCLPGRTRIFVRRLGEHSHEERVRPMVELRAVSRQTTVGKLNCVKAAPPAPTYAR